MNRFRALTNFQRRPSKDAPQPSATPDDSSNGPANLFFDFARSLGTGSRVLEVGTKQAVDGVSSHSWKAFPNVARENYLMADVAPGGDVDLVADLHALPPEWTNRFNAFLAIAVFEHLERPWLAAKEVARVLAPGGLCYISTHQTFPLHGYPSDYFRFSKEALALLFDDAGMQVLDVAYLYRSKIVAPEAIVPSHFHEEWNATWPSYLIVHLTARKVA